MKPTSYPRVHLRHGLVTAGLLTLYVCFAAGQVPGESAPAFEVASVRGIDSVTSPQMVIRTPPGGGLEARRVTPRFLIRYAFAIDDSLIVGAPGWTGSARFDVMAKGAADVPAEVTRAMLRTLLRERFNLRSHTEARDLPVYVLVPARRDPQLGRNLRPANVACVERDQAAPRPSRPKSLPPPSQSLPCGLRVAFGHISGGGITMQDVVNVLTQPTSRPVLDQTALVGRFDLVLNFTPEALRVAPSPDRQGAAQLQSDPLPTPADPSAPSIFTAVQEQLGLKLDSSRGQIEVLVIDNVERPDPN